MALVRQCPVCPRVLRPRSLDPDASARSLREHIREKARVCAAHQLVRDRLFGASAVCPVCTERFPSAEDACEHITSAQDEAHAALREGSGVLPMQASALAPPRDPGRATHRDKRALSRALYSAAKSGRADEVVRCLLAEAVNPNAKHDDGFTALMTASEAGHESVVDVLLGHPKCDVNAANHYGQSALCLAAINGRLDVVLRLLQDDRVDVESLGGGLSVAEKARRAGFNTVADILAQAAKGRQVSQILQVTSRVKISMKSMRKRLSNFHSTTLQAVTDGFASGDFDSITQRLQALSNRLAVQQQQEDDDKASEIDMLCSVCLIQPIEVVVAPCFHACLCSACAGESPTYPPFPWATSHV